MWVTYEGDAAVLHGPLLAGPGERVEREVEPSVPALREWVRKDDSGRYRPLSGAKTLPTGWRIVCRDAPTGTLNLGEAMDIVYPQALVHITQYVEGTLRTVSLEGALARQKGRYAVAQELSPRGRRVAREVLCGRCVRNPVWAEGALTIAEGAIPCPEPCSVMVALCREAALWEADPPEPTAVDTTVGWAAFDVRGNEVREEYTRRLQSRREATMGPTSNTG